MNAVSQMSSLRELSALGQSVWLDCVERGILYSSQLKRLIEDDGLSGASLNFRAFEQAVASSGEYDRAIAELAGRGLHAESVYRNLAIEDAQVAADLLRTMYEATDGCHGFVSLELSPHLAYDTPGLTDEAWTLWTRVKRPNALIKIPGTAAGVAAVRTLIAEGVNVHVTLLFGRFRYAHIANAYIAGLTRRAIRGLPVDRVASVASFRLSCIDTLLDPRLEAMAAAGSDKAARLAGEVAIAEAKLVHARYCELFHSQAFAELANKGARPQRLLWAATATENAAYAATSYIEPLIGPHTVTELSLATIGAYRDRGYPDLRLGQATLEAAAAIANLATLGVDFQDVEMLLEAQEIQNCVASYEKAIEALENKIARLLQCGADRTLVEPPQGPPGLITSCEAR